MLEILDPVEELWLITDGLIFFVAFGKRTFPMAIFAPLQY